MATSNLHACARLLSSLITINVAARPRNYFHDDTYLFQSEGYRDRHKALSQIDTKPYVCDQRDKDQRFKNLTDMEKDRLQLICYIRPIVCPIFLSYRDVVPLLPHGTMKQPTVYAALAGAIYYFGHPIHGWDIVKSMDMQSRTNCAYNDNYAIYRKGNGHPACAVVIAGTDEGLSVSSFNRRDHDWATNRDAAYYQFCRTNKMQEGVTVHRGYAKRAEHFFEMAQKEEWFEILRDPEWCGNGTKGGTDVTVIGHSLGGGVANLIAYCADADDKFPVEKLFTIGAPAVFRTSPEDEQCWERGFRVWTHDRGRMYGSYADPIPMFSTFYGFHHPKTNELELIKSSAMNNRTVGRLVSCKSTQRPMLSQDSIPLDVTSMHSKYEYVRRLSTLYKMDLSPLSPKPKVWELADRTQEEWEKSEKDGSSLPYNELE